MEAAGRDKISWIEGVPARLARGADECARPYTLRMIDAQTLCQFFVEESFTGAIGLEPAAVNHQLRDGALARSPDNLLGGTGRGFDVNFFVGNIVGGQKAPERP